MSPYLGDTTTGFFANSFAVKGDRQREIPSLQRERSRSPLRNNRFSGLARGGQPNQKERQQDHRRCSRSPARGSGSRHRQRSRTPPNTNRRTISPDSAPQKLQPDSAFDPYISLVGERKWLEPYKDPRRHPHIDFKGAEASILHIKYFRNRCFTDADIAEVLCHGPDPSPEAKDEQRKFKARVQLLQRKILTDNILRKIFPQVGKRVPNGQNLKDLSIQDQKRLFVDFWIKDPHGAAETMWGPIASTVDFTGIFQPPATSSQHHRVLMKRWRTYCFNTFLFALSATIALRYPKDNKKGKDRLIEDWMELDQLPGFEGPPDVEEILVSP